MNKSVIDKAQAILDGTNFNFRYYEAFRKQFWKWKLIEKIDSDEKTFLIKMIDNNIRLTIIYLSNLYDSKERDKWNEVLSFYQIAKDIWYNNLEDDLKCVLWDEILTTIKNIKKYRSKMLAHIDYKYCIKWSSKDTWFTYEDLHNLICLWYNIIDILISHTEWNNKKIKKELNNPFKDNEDTIVQKICKALI
jgi:hypothetical protein